MSVSHIIANRQTRDATASSNCRRCCLPIRSRRCCSAADLFSTVRCAGLRESLTPLLIGTEIVSHEASPQEIDARVALARPARRVVAIGGGSVLDAAKAFSALVEHPLPTLRYMEKWATAKSAAPPCR